MEDPILDDCSIYCDVTTTLTRDIQNSYVAKYGLLPLPAPLPFILPFKIKINLLPFYSAYTLIVEFPVKHLLRSAHLMAVFDQLVNMCSILESSALKWQHETCSKEVTTC